MRPKWATATMCMIAAVGLLMLAVYTALLNQARPGLPYTVTGTWMSIFLVVFSAGPLVADLVSKASACCCSCCLSCCGCCSLAHGAQGFFWRHYHRTTAVISSLLSLGWFVGGRYDGGLWGLSVLLVAGIYVYIERQGVASTSIQYDLEENAEHDPAAASASGAASHSPQDPAQIGFKQTIPQTNAGFPMPQKICEHIRPELVSSSNAQPDELKTDRRASVASCVLASLRAIALVLYAFLLGGCWLQAIGYRSFAPDGTFITLKVSGVDQRILTKCSGPRSEILPTIWVEVGGGGHSMSDIWGLRDHIVSKYQRRVCSYDMPGTGWSDPLLHNQTRFPTAQV
jgi:hypothetical protein